jgi:hypothetical protein
MSDGKEGARERVLKVLASKAKKTDDVDEVEPKLAPLYEDEEQEQVAEPLDLEVAHATGPAEVEHPEEDDVEAKEDADAPQAPRDSSTNRKFRQMMEERHPLSRKYLGKKARY